MTGGDEPVAGEGKAATSRTPTAEDVRAAVDRLLGSDKISRNPNTSRFLKFIVGETLEGRGERLKAFSIATQALGRTTDFDPQSDSIVRVQAVRVRAQLDEYYSGPGAADPVRIVLPKGTYQPRFEFAPAPEAAPATVAKDERVLPSRAPPPFAASRWSAVWSVVAVVAVAALALIAAYARRVAPPPPAHGTPILDLSARVAPGKGLEGVADMFLAQLESDAASEDYIRVHRAGLTRADDAADYKLFTEFAPAGAGAFRLVFTLTEAQSGEVVWSRSIPRIDNEDAAGQERIAQDVITAVADTGGAVQNDMLQRFEKAGAPLKGPYCQASALMYLMYKSPAAPDANALEKCLDDVVAKEPDNPIALRLLSTLLVNGYVNNSPGNQGEIDVQRALQFARRAYDLDPKRENGLAALFYARFVDKRYEDAFAFADKILKMNPDSSLIRIRIGRAFVSRGRYADGAAQLQVFEAREGAPQPISTAYLALAALMQDNSADLSRYTRRVVIDSTPLGLLLGAIDCRQQGDAKCVEERKSKLKKEYPGFADAPSMAFDRYGFTDAISQRLRAGAAEIGLTGAP